MHLFLCVAMLTAKYCESCKWHKQGLSCQIEEILVSTKWLLCHFASVKAIWTPRENLIDLVSSGQCWKSFDQ